MTALVFAQGEEVRASSRDVAATFGKNHRDVLRAIDKLIEQEPSLSVAQFCAAEFQQEGRQAQAHRYFEMNRDGFALLAMGFTGPQALKFKLAYIEAFNRMEASLRAPDTDPADDLLPATTDMPEAPDEFERLRVKLQMVREARIAFGPAAARRVWQAMGLSDAVEAPPAPVTTLGGFVSQAYASVNAWLDSRVEWVPGQRWSATGLWNDYVRWCRGGEGHEAISLTAFGKYLSTLGIGSHRSNVVYRVGLKLREA